MRIATWNVERLSPQKRLPSIMEQLRRVNADILVLTETDRRIQPDYEYAYHTPLLAENVDGDSYRSTENRVSIFTKVSRRPSSSRCGCQHVALRRARNGARLTRGLWDDLRHSWKPQAVVSAGHRRADGGCAALGGAWSCNLPLRRFQLFFFRQLLFHELGTADADGNVRSVRPGARDRGPAGVHRPYRTFTQLSARRHSNCSREEPR